MPFTSIAFATWFLLVLTAFWCVRGWRTGQKVLLLLASAWFYGAWNPRLLLLLGVGCAVGYLGGEAVSRTQGRLRSTALWATLGGYLLLLGFFKYYDFFRVNLDEVAARLQLSSHLPLLHVALPLGISFYTFQGMAYVIDIHRGHGPKARHFFDFALFMALFPQLVLGPICRSRDLLPQLEAPAPDGIPDFSRAVSLLVSGVFKKVILIRGSAIETAFSSRPAKTSPESRRHDAPPIAPPGAGRTNPLSLGTV